MKGVDFYKRNFVETIISVSFFRVPEFRKKFLTIIMEKGDMDIEEWRNTEGMPLKDRDKDDEFHHNPVIVRMFDW